VTATFLVIGGIGLFLLAASVLLGGHVHIGHLHIHLPFHFRTHGGAGHPAADAALSLPSIAGFVGAFGFGGAIASQLLPGRSATVPSLIGLAAALPTAWAATRLTRAAMQMRTDATPTQIDVVGAIGTVIRDIPDGGYGEVRVAFAGQLMKFHARAAVPLPAGAPVMVIDAPSTTSVVVESTAPLPG